MPEESKSQEEQERPELTRSFKPSERRRTASLPGGLNLLPVMNLMVILIPVLLAQSAAIKLALHEVDLPTGGGGDTTASDEAKKQERLSLTVNITNEGFDILSAFGREPTIPMKDGAYDYEVLNAKLMDIGEQIGKSGMKFDDRENVTLMSDPGIKYDVLVQVMDAVKWDDEGKKLFPGILLSPGKVQVR